MKRSRPVGTTLLTLLALVLALGLTVGLASCRSLRSDTTETVATTEGGATDATAAEDQAGSQTSAENILFHDDFQDGDSEGWQVGPSWVVQQDGDLYTFDTTGEGYALVPKGVGWDGDYALKASYLLEQGTLAFSFYATQNGRYYVPIDEGLISIVKEDAAREKTVLTQAEAPEMGVQHYIVIAKQNGTIQVYVDRNLWLSAEDPDPYAEGTIILGSVDGTTAWVDDVLVNRITRALPQGDPAVEPMDPSQVVAPPDDDPDLGDLPDPGDDGGDLPDDNDPDDIPLPVVSLTAWENGDRPVPETRDLTVEPGAIVLLEWETENVGAAFLNGVPYPTDSSYTAQIHDDINYELEVIGLDQATYSYYVRVTVTGADGGGDDGAELGPDPELHLVEVQPRGGTDVRVGIVVENAGDQKAEDFTVYWYADENDAVVRSATVSLEEHETYSLTWDYTYEEYGTMHWMASIDEEGMVPDTDRSNNVVRGTVELIQL